MAYWAQKTVTLSSKSRGCHLITDEIYSSIAQDIHPLKTGLLHIFCTHTSCSLTLNENYDSDVRRDMEDSLNRLVPESSAYRHNDEGPDDLPAHVKSSLFGVSHFVPISNGKLVLGTWQGIYLCEHRNGSRRREIVCTITGSTQ